jgi:hypothetical protein
MAIVARRFNPAGSMILAPVQPVEIEGKIYPLAVPTVIVYIVNTATGYREFTRFCRHIGLVLLQDETGKSPHGEGCWEVSGQIDSLERLTGDGNGLGSHPSVRSWHPVFKQESYKTRGKFGKDETRAEVNKANRERRKVK